MSEPRVEAVLQEFHGQSVTEGEGFIAPNFFAMAHTICDLRAALTLANQRAESLLVINGDLARDAERLEAECKALEQRAEATEAETKGWEATADKAIRQNGSLLQERDALRKVDDAMIERAAKAEYFYQNEAPTWEETQDDVREVYRDSARRHLEAALAVQPTTEDK